VNKKGNLYEKTQLFGGTKLLEKPKLFTNLRGLLLFCDLLLKVTRFFKEKLFSLI